MILQQRFLLIATVQLNSWCVVDMAAVVTGSRFHYLNQTEAAGQCLSDCFMSVQCFNSLLIDLD